MADDASESSATTVFDATGPSDPCPPRLDGLPLFMPHRVTIVDPDTEYLDGGSISVTCESGWLACCGVDLLSPDQQCTLWSFAGTACPDADFQQTVLEIAEDNVLYATTNAENAHDPAAVTKERLGVVVVRSSIARPPGSTGKEAKDAAANPNEPMNDPDRVPTAAPPPPPPREASTPVGDPLARRPPLEAAKAPTVFEVEFDAHAGDAVDPWVVTLTLVRQLVHSIALAVNRADVDRIADSAKQRFSLCVVDQRNSEHPGIASLTVDLQPRLFAVPLFGSPNAASIQQWRGMCADAKPAEPLPAPPSNLVLRQ
jgi:hypothetical protein